MGWGVGKWVFCDIFNQFDKCDNWPNLSIRSISKAGAKDTPVVGLKATTTVLRPSALRFDGRRTGLDKSSLVKARHPCQGLYSSVVERQSCKLKVLGSIPSGGFSGEVNA